MPEVEARSIAHWIGCIGRIAVHFVSSSHSALEAAVALHVVLLCQAEVHAGLELVLDLAGLEAPEAGISGHMNALVVGDTAGSAEEACRILPDTHS